MAHSIEYGFQEDLLTEILIRLPVKPLLRLKTVSKLWLVLISSPTFIRSHIRRAIRIPQSDEIVVLGRDGPSVSLVSLSSSHIGVTTEVCHLTGNFGYSVVGSCNGIVCVSLSSCSGIYDKMCLWNPATKQYKPIPPHSICTTIDMNVCSGFGFDPIGDDFKVVRIISNFGDPTCVGVEVYSVNMDSWRRVDPPITAMSVDFDVCVRGVLCCRDSDCLMTFDLEKEVFNYIKFPPIEYYWPCITEYRDSLSVIDYLNDYGNWKIRLWMLDDACLHGGVEESWTLMFSFHAAFVVCVVGCCLNSGDILLKARKGGIDDDDDDDDNDDDDGGGGGGYTWYLCNPDNKEFKNVNIPKCECEIVKHVESLVSIRGSKQVMCDVNADDNLERQQLFWF